ncbi:hypothetical protein [Qipengyuania sp. MTN3-11]|uniref:hypothetical protein n=1 Tax=Qipengyuania sp. MTN3-11 TaxID=3056557 RepID=UPI0036F3EFFA
MKNYEMYRSTGGKVSVGTMLMALKISSEFKATSMERIADLGNTEPMSNEFYASCDALFARWNHNHEIIELMNADPEFQEQNRRSSYALNLLQIADMAGKCEEEGPPLADQ